MNLSELSAALRATEDVLRVETLDAYSSVSDVDYVERFHAGEPKPDPAEKQAWLDRLRAAADRGHPWRRVRVVPRPVPGYVRYACEWGYIDNVAAGEEVRVVDAGQDPDTARRLRDLGDFYLADHRVLRMRYGQDGAFDRAEDVAATDQYADAAHDAFDQAVPFLDWWHAHPDLHREHVLR